MSESRRSLFRLPGGLKALQAFLCSWTVAVFVFLYAPILVLVIYSFNSSRLSSTWGGLTMKWYSQLMSNTLLVRAAENSVVIALITTVASVIIGTGGAWLMHRYRYQFEGLIRTFVALPMVMPEILMGVSLLIFFSLMQIPLGFTTVCIGHITFCFPFVLVAVQARLRGLDPSLEEAAMDLGASPLQAFWLVIVPCLRPAIMAGALMAFTLSMDELIVTYFTYSASSATLPIRVYGMAKVGLNPMLNALSAIFILVTIVVVLFSEYIKRLSNQSALNHDA
jgi:spermidine/putrescine transport system permease protein